MQTSKRIIKTSLRPCPVLKRTGPLAPIWGVLLLGAQRAAAQAANTQTLSSGLPEMGASVLRMLGALGFVLAVFLGAVWVYRNWERFAARKGRLPKLDVLEVKSLGGRHALYLVGYEAQRFLIGSSPSGINLLAELPKHEFHEVAREGKAVAEAEVAPSFVQSLQQALAGKSQT